MVESLLLKGALIGVSIAAPVGPIGALCIKRSIAEGRQVGLATGLGAATADGVYGLIAALGLTALTSFLVGQQFWFSLVGGIFLGALAWKTFRATPSSKAAQDTPGSLGAAYASTFVLTMTNPMTILSFIAVFAGLQVGVESGSGGGRIIGALSIVIGVFLGSACWWLLLSSLASWLGKRLNESALRWVNYVSASILGVFGALALVHAFRL